MHKQASRTLKIHGLLYSILSNGENLASNVVHLIPEEGLSIYEFDRGLGRFESRSEGNGCDDMGLQPSYRRLDTRTVQF
jgi:hypothetical protein